MASVELDGIGKRYGSLSVIEGLNLDVRDGELLILVGPSGCGKSTLLRIIAGLESISGGELRIGGRLVNEMAPRDRNIAMVFQSYALYPHKTVAQNMGFSLMLAKRPKAEIERKVKEAADILNLGGLLDRYPKQLSGGQRQRVAMGRAIVRDPEVFLFDEPLSNLDAKLRVQMRAEIKALHERLGTTMIYVTHDQVEAMTMADRIVVLNRGHIEQVGAPLELYDRPANLFVADFIGSPSMNLMPGRVEDDGFRLDGGGIVPLPSGLLPTGRELVLGIRPQHLLPAADDAPAALPVRVLLQEPTGDETFVEFAFGSDHIRAVFRERVVIGSGESFSLAFDPARLHVFDKASGERLSANN
ncbi:ABC transporter ATP-binding protein [Pleomorphomonas carboxyditropha]|uniref:Sugar ABC transporter ATP-binding protein n=1 Tax=Pleomorphomonas carboxyditropha TaxID=2023338 RepID=A0A2G9X2N1_9HYPH|nr:sn-glycerol-3-phosphate ABC transporter ATP-binding protein UgpC [Pleomorphomonas carboxyditropha]PIP01229.1 sugar ABC transporter ATP-binding protein [Pleomorphomonas carboxyditropha]